MSNMTTRECPVDGCKNSVTGEPDLLLGCCFAHSSLLALEKKNAKVSASKEDEARRAAITAAAEVDTHRQLVAQVKHDRSEVVVQLGEATASTADPLPGHPTPEMEKRIHVEPEHHAKASKKHR